METREIRLSHNRPLRIAGTLTFECVAGRVWLTRQGMPADVFLHPGDRHALDWPDSALVEALGEARIVLRIPSSPWRDSLRRFCRAARFLLSSPHEWMRALRGSRRRNPLAG